MSVTSLTPSPQDAWQTTNQHCELPAEYFAAYLDRRLRYSSGWYSRSVTTLDEAQTAKLRFVADQLGLTGSEAVLDVGCGWGSLVMFLATNYGCAVTGVTPSATQAAYVTALATEFGVRDRVSVIYGSFDEIAVPARFDGVSMLGSIVHTPERTEVLRKAYGLLNRGGALYVSETCFRNNDVYREFAARPGTRHLTHGIFGFADMVPLSTLVAAIEDAGFSLSGLSDLTAHYKRTIEDWEARAGANRATIERLSPGSFDPLVKYFQTANAGWGYTTKHYAISARKARLGPMLPAAKAREGGG
jgi:cyclopropane-fatty-acyl-phospholipid synthase